MELLHKDLSYKVIGALYKVYNTLGYGYKEKEYQKALEEELKVLSLPFEREKYSQLKYGDKIIAGFYVDFLICGILVVELKVANEAYQKHFNQVLAYLKNYNLQLGLIAAFTPHKIVIKRVVNQRSAKSA